MQSQQKVLTIDHAQAASDAHNIAGNSGSAARTSASVTRLRTLPSPVKARRKLSVEEAVRDAIRRTG